ncbi:alpha/beta fold hydrolase [Legionella spiritensis]|uniref:Lipase A n=1 Tax=Legionella spiritensis TaxID=452 RepID=A0A0W0Z9X1_LEGSP|nr:alpha/beta hydrolase [Legionella spiritensis]KTD65909.1 lipase A [Legionella spiritensis]SNV31903.1 lipase A [Legionella spiritensis]
MNAKTLMLSIPGFTIGYKIWGHKQNPAILALHGWLDNANSFELLAPCLEQDFYVIAVDLPGHGYSSHLPAGCNYHFIDGIFILINILNALQLKKTHLLGHSMGACLASLAAGVAPERFHSLALIEAIGPFSHPERTCRSQLSNYLLQQLNEITKQEKHYASREDAAKARAKTGYLSLEHARILCERGVRKEGDVYYWQHDRRLLTPNPLRLTETQIISCLENIDVKTCLLLAEQGFNFDEEDMQRRINAVRDIEVVQYRGGHHLHMEQPDTVGQYLVDFFRNA